MGGTLRVRAAVLYSSCLNTLFFRSGLARLPLYADPTVPVWLSPGFSRQPLLRAAEWGGAEQQETWS